MNHFDPHLLNIAFQIPQVHRIRFTEDVLGIDHQVLLDLIEPSSHQPARVLAWIDDQVVRASPDLPERLATVLSVEADFVDLAEPPQLLVGGEACKNDPQIVDRLLERIHRHNLDRRSYIVVVGGGAILDAVGYAASIAHRGIRLIRLPTTTLAQADSGVGVKNAVNRFSKKNWVGTFTTPWGVINDAKLLRTLSDRDWRCGFAEAVKVTALKDASAFAHLAQRASAIAAREESLSQEVLRTSVLLHLRHITDGGDPFETLEARPLDFGHWAAHRLEALSEFRIRHGEAVAIGLAIDCIYSTLVCGLPESACQQVIKTLEDLKLPISDRLLNDPEALLTGLEEFRQHLGGRLTITLLRNIGDGVDVHEIDHRAMREAIAKVHRRSRLKS